MKTVKGPGQNCLMELEVDLEAQNLLSKLQEPEMDKESRNILKCWNNRPEFKDRPE